MNIDKTLEKRLKALEKVAHAPQNYRQRCKAMEMKIEKMEIDLEKLREMIAETGR